MNEQKIRFVCLKCDSFLENCESGIKCKKCKKLFEKNKNFYNFSDDNQATNFENNTKLEELVKKIEQYSYQKGIKEFLKKFPYEKHYLINTKFDQSADAIFHCINYNSKTCLVIGDDYGNTVEILSKIFEKVVSIHNSKISVIFQGKRFEEEKILNIEILYINSNDLPFEDNIFDLILIKNKKIYEQLSTYQSKITKSEYLPKIKEILSKNGCLCLSLENKFNLQFLLNKNSSKFSEFNKYSFKNYLKILQKLDFNIKTYWGYPSTDRPYFSGRIDDKLSLKWYFQNFNSFVKGTKIGIRQKILFFILKYIPNSIRHIIIQKFSPFFIFCCYKQENTSIENSILEQTESNQFLLISRRIKLIFILFGVNGNPKSIVHLKRFGKKVVSNLSIHKRTFPHMENPDEQMWLEEWKNGRPLNPTNENEIISAIGWLVEFQKNTSQGFFTEEDLKNEIVIIQNEIKNGNISNKKEYQEWIKDYESIFTENKIKKSAIHGDFWYANMLYNRKQKTVNLVDWENYKKDGNPFHDLTTFIMRCMMISKSDPVESFRFNLTKNMKFINTLNKIQKIINFHFSFSVNFNVLLRYLILRNVAKVVDKNSVAHNNYLKMLKILEENVFFQSNLKN